MPNYNSYEDPDYYLKRTRTLLQNDYPLDIIEYNFMQSDLFMVRWHWHEEVEFEIIEKGQVYITCEENNILADEGDIVFINQNVRHFFTPAAPEGCILHSVIAHPMFIFGFGQLEMEKKYISPILYDTALKYVHITKDNPHHAEYTAFLQEILSVNQAKASGYELISKAALLRIWNLLYSLITPASANLSQKTAVQDEQRVKQAILYIQEHFMETVTLEDIAGSIMVSKSECCRCFKRALNVTPFEYLMKYRIMESTKRMHRKPQESISEIAGSVGFNNTSYYNKIFRKFMGCTPTEYRNSIKKELPKFT